MSHSIMRMADKIMDGMLTNPAQPNRSVAPNAAEEKPLPEISDEARASLVTESMQSSAMDEKLGPELKKHAKTGETSYSPGGSEKHTSVDISSDAEKKLSPGAKAKLKSHRQRSGSRSDQRTSWAVDMPQGGQKAKWQAERERQSKHSASRGKPTKGAKPQSGTTKDPWGHGTHSNTSTDSIQARKVKLSQKGQSKMAKKEPEHQARRRADAEQQRTADREKWKRTNPSMKKARDDKAARLKAQRSAHAAGGPAPTEKASYNPARADRKRKEAMQNASVTLRKSSGTMTLCDSWARKVKTIMYGENKMTQDDIQTLMRAREILVGEGTSVGGIGSNQMAGSANKAYHQQRHQNANAWTPDTPIAPVDKALSKVGDKKITKKKVAKALKDRLKKKNEAPTEAFEKFLELVLSDIQLEDKDWIQDATDDIEKRGTKGKCTPVSKPGCTGKAKALAKTFKKMGEAGDEQDVNDEDHAPASSKSAKKSKKNKKKMKRAESK